MRSQHTMGALAPGARSVYRRFVPLRITNPYSPSAVLVIPSALMYSMSSVVRPANKNRCTHSLLLSFEGVSVVSHSWWPLIPGTLLFCVPSMNKPG